MCFMFLVFIIFSLYLFKIHTSFPTELIPSCILNNFLLFLIYSFYYNSSMLFFSLIGSSPNVYSIVQYLEIQLQRKDTL